MVKGVAYIPTEFFEIVKSETFWLNKKKSILKTCIIALHVTAKHSYSKPRGVAKLAIRATCQQTLATM